MVTFLFCYDTPFPILLTNPRKYAIIWSTLSPDIEYTPATPFRPAHRGHSWKASEDRPILSRWNKKCGDGYEKPQRFCGKTGPQSGSCRVRGVMQKSLDRRERCRTLRAFGARGRPQGILHGKVRPSQQACRGRGVCLQGQERHIGLLLRSVYAQARPRNYADRRCTSDRQGPLFR